MKFFLVLLSAVILSHDVFSQISRSQVPINLFDSKGKKNGFWSEKDNDIKIESNYVNGIKNGVEKAYYRNGTLMSFLEYKDGHRNGVGYFFHEQGYLIFTIKYIGSVLYKSQKLQKGYFVIYKASGTIKERGIGLFKEGDEELGEEIRVGEWKKF